MPRKKKKKKKTLPYCWMAANWTRVGFFRILQRMGAVVIGDLEEPTAAPDAEPLCELDVRPRPADRARA